MEDYYEINSETLALIPINNNKTKIHELDKSFIIRKSIKKIVDDSCKTFGSSFRGRQEGSYKIMGINYKTPIIVSEAKEIIFFPTNSPRVEDCCWISLQNIEVYKKSNSKTLICFKNKEEIEIDTSFSIIENQFYKATMLESKLRKINIKVK